MGLSDFASGEGLRRAGRSSWSVAQCATVCPPGEFSKAAVPEHLTDATPTQTTSRALQMLKELRASKSSVYQIRGLLKIITYTYVYVHVYIYVYVCIYVYVYIRMHICF